MTHKNKPVTRETVREAWTGSFVGVLLFLVIFPAFLWGWDEWWSYMIAGFMLITPISMTLTYYTREKIRCPYCQAELTTQSKVCPQCGVEILAVCPACQKSTQWGARFCDSCGANLRDLAMKRRQEAGGTPITTPVPTAPSVVFCPTCGEQVSDGAKFCFRCGTAVK